MNVENPQASETVDKVSLDLETAGRRIADFLIGQDTEEKLVENARSNGWEYTQAMITRTGEIQENDSAANIIKLTNLRRALQAIDFDAEAARVDGLKNLTPDSN
ncbi:MAG: hypothetical protein WC250_01460 [Candidatus Paceibacterota bacterium]|jgi:hypothetical protein